MGFNWFPTIKLVALSIVAGIGLRFVIGLEPIWWLAWLAPAPLLAIAFRQDNKRIARALVATAALVATSVNFSYYAIVMSAAAAVAVTVGQALLWCVAVMGARRVVLRYAAWWTVFAYPVLWIALDTAMAALLPDGNWGNIGYSQYEFLPALQVAALFGAGRYAVHAHRRPGGLAVRGAGAGHAPVDGTVSGAQAWRASRSPVNCQRAAAGKKLR